MRCEIYLFRHGTTCDNANGVFSGWRDVGLNSKGIRDAKIVALRLKDKKIGASFHSGMRRSKETLREVLRFHPECKKIILDRRIMEKRYGKLQGKTHLSVVERFGCENYDKWHRSYDTRPPEGESVKDVEKRLLRFIADLIKFMKRNKVNVAISGHGNSIRPLRRYFEKTTKEEMCKLYNDYETVYTYSIKV